jgi:hypothetical protein
MLAVTQKLEEMASQALPQQWSMLLVRPGKEQPVLLQKCRVPRKSGVSICSYNALVSCGGANHCGLAFAAHLACEGPHY